MHIVLHDVLSKAFCAGCWITGLPDRYYQIKFIPQQTMEYVQDCAKLLSTLNLDTFTQFSTKDGHYLLFSELSFKEDRSTEKLGALYHLAEFPLHLAAVRGCIYLFKKHLQAGAEVNRQDVFCETPLHIAARGGHFEIFTLLLEHGANVNHKTINGETIIRIAISLQDSTLLQKTLAVSGVEVDSKDDEGNTYLHLAAQVGNEVILSQLIEAGMAIESRNQRGETPFISAVIANNQSTALFLLKRGANIDNQDHEGTTALNRAVSQANYFMAEALFLKGANIKAHQNEIIQWLATSVSKEKAAVAKECEVLECKKMPDSAHKEGKVLRLVNFFTIAANLQTTQEPEQKKIDLMFGMN